MTDHRTIHFIGIGGSGISALAYLSLAQGFKVSGSDTSISATTESLKKAGAQVFTQHDAKHLPEETELVIITEAIPETNPELIRAREMGIPIMTYFQALGALSSHKTTIAVCGTHGKTTTTAMLGEIMVYGGVDPTVIVGSRVPAFDYKNIHVGQSEWLVVEACEYRRSFLNLTPYGVVLLNCEVDHLDYYRDKADYESAFREFILKIPADGFLVYNADDASAAEIARHCKGRRIPVTQTDVEKTQIELIIPGAFNRFNATEAFEAAKMAEIPEGVIRTSLKKFRGTARRMEIKGEKDGVLVLDDYAHHPTEIRSTLKALREFYAGRYITCVFQPHQYSRTFQLLEDFKTAFQDADRVLIPNIYEARDTEEDKKRISAASFVVELSKNHPNVQYTESFEKTLEVLNQEVKKGDLVVTMGAGDVFLVGERLIEPQS